MTKRQSRHSVQDYIFAKRVFSRIAVPEFMMWYMNKKYSVTCNECINIADAATYKAVHTGIPSILKQPTCYGINSRRHVWLETPDEQLMVYPADRSLWITSPPCGRGPQTSCFRYNKMLIGKCALFRAHLPGRNLMFGTKLSSDESLLQRW